jgi:hypothetical protein
LVSDHCKTALSPGVSLDPGNAKAQFRQQVEGRDKVAELKDWEDGNLDNPGTARACPGRQPSREKGKFEGQHKIIDFSTLALIILITFVLLMKKLWCCR